MSPTHRSTLSHIMLSSGWCTIYIFICKIVQHLVLCKHDRHDLCFTASVGLNFRILVDQWICSVSLEFIKKILARTTGIWGLYWSWKMTVQASSLMWVGSCFFSTMVSSMVLLECPNMLTDWLILKVSDPSGPNQKLQCLLWPTLRNDTASLWLYFIDLIVQPWFSIEGK